MGRRVFSIYVADAFAERVFGGNQAGVVLLGEGQDFPEESLMQKIAGEMKHSETAFVKRTARDAFRVRYFTPVEEVALCGHATIGTFGVLCEEGWIADGSFRLYPGAPVEGLGGEAGAAAGEALEVTVAGGNVWMEMAAPRVEGELTRAQALELYEAFGLDGEAELSRLGEQRKKLSRPGEQQKKLLPAIVNTGLSDVILPVGSLASLNKAVLDCGRITELSRRYRVVGVHMFCIPAGTGEEPHGVGDQVTAHCRNFAPAVGIDEESATGTSNGALTWYLYLRGLLQPQGEHVFLQGEAMGKPSCIKSTLKISSEREGVRGVVRIGGRAQISLKGRLYAEEQEGR